MGRDMYNIVPNIAGWAHVISQLPLQGILIRNLLSQVIVLMVYVVRVCSDMMREFFGMVLAGIANCESGGSTLV